jgi:hypothetical protein
MPISKEKERENNALLLQQEDILFDKLYQFLIFSDDKNPTIYDKIQNLQEIDLHNRLVFEFSIRNKNNREFIDKLIKFYDEHTEKIILFINLIKDINNFSYNMFLDENEDFYKSNDIFFTLTKKLENIEFLPFNFYDEDSKYRHHLIPLKLFEIMNQIYTARKLLAKNTSETQLDKVIDDKTIEYIGNKGFLIRLEKTDTSNFFVENHYLNDASSFFYKKTILKYKTSEIEMNPSFMTHNISLNINLALDDESLKKLIDDFSKNIQELKENQKNAISKYESTFKKKKKSTGSYFIKDGKNIAYSKILYSYDLLNLYSKERIIQKYNLLTKLEQEKISPSEYSSNEEKKKDYYLSKEMIYFYLNKKLGYQSTSRYIKNQISNLEKIINEKLYLNMI